MCLIIDEKFHKDLKPKVARKDITCYKILEIKDKNLYTPYKGKRVILKKGLVAETFETKPIYRVAREQQLGEFIYPCPVYEISCAIHTYANTPLKVSKEEAEKAAWWRGRYAVMECVIPKGTLYWKGLCAHDVVSYASEKIKFIRNISKDIPYTEI